MDVVWAGACQRGEDHLTLMVRCGCGVGWGMSTSCTSYVDGTLWMWSGGLALGGGGDNMIRLLLLCLYFRCVSVLQSMSYICQ